MNITLSPKCSTWNVTVLDPAKSSALQGKAGKDSLDAVPPQGDSGAPMQAAQGASNNHTLTHPTGIHPAGHPRCTPPRCAPGHPHSSCAERLKPRRSLLPRTRTLPQLTFLSLHVYFIRGSPRQVTPTGPRVPRAQTPTPSPEGRREGTNRQLITEADVANRDLQCDAG